MIAYLRFVPRVYEKLSKQKLRLLTKQYEYQQYLDSYALYVSNLSEHAYEAISYAHFRRRVVRIEPASILLLPGAAQPLQDFVPAITRPAPR